MSTPVLKKSDFNKPWMLVQNQIRSPGGYAMDIFRGKPDPKDIPNGSEAWVGSITRANGATADNPHFGHAEAILPNGQKHYLVDLINSSPQEILGENHFKKYGCELGMLIKLLDAQKMYFLQSHPTRETAAKLWNSSYGKEECWYIISTRDNLPENPYILLGFKEGITREHFEHLFKTSTLQELEKLCHKIPVKAGEAYFVPGGCPHALGAGCLVAEIQEPSDLNAIAITQKELLDYRRKAAPNGVFEPIDNELYESRTLGSFIYEGYSCDEILEKCKSKFPLVRSGENWEERAVFDKQYTNYFSCSIYNVNNSAMPYETLNSISICVVLSGTGVIKFPEGEISVKQGDELFFPYNVENVTFEGDMSVIVCRPG